MCGRLIGSVTAIGRGVSTNSRMAQIAETLNDLIKTVVDGMGYECVGVELQRHRGPAVLRVYIDREDGILVDDCSRVSHQLSGVLDVEDPIPGNYHLEVSSPGMDRPLFELEHYLRFRHHNVKLELRSPLHGRRRFKGEVLGVDGKNILLRESGNDIVIPFGIVSNARLAPDLKVGRNG